MSDRPILLVTSARDIHAQSVIRELDALQHPYILWNKAEIPEKSKLAHRLTSAGAKSKLQVEGTPLDLSSVSSAWLRRPGKVLPRGFDAEWMGKMVERETNRAVEAVFRSMNCLWVNHPERQERVLNKVWQLEAARNCGLDVPETLITNDCEEVRRFYEECGKRLIYKLIDEFTQTYIPRFETPAGIATMMLRPEDIEHLEQVAFSMHLFQQAIDKVCDVRLTIIGRKQFAVAITSANIDWRIAEDAQKTVHTLPEDVAVKCAELMARFGLNYGAIDLSLGKDGKYYFLELNPAGQFLWLEQDLNLPLSRELALLLAGESEPVVRTFSNASQN